MTRVMQLAAEQRSAPPVPAIISERLEIRIGTLQAYVTRLYRKTGTKTRSGLLELYHNTRIDG